MFSNVNLTVVKGKSYIFNIEAIGHPFWIKTAQSTGQLDLYNDGITNNGGALISYGAIYGQFYSVSMSNKAYLCIQVNTGYNTNTNEWIRVAYGSFTAFHRCYTDDVLYNGETTETIDIFKNDYMGRVVITTGKIKTDLSRDVETPEPTEPDTSDIKKAPDSEWYSLIDKDGITIEDAVPVV
ncbi:MAG: hypothetical protein AN484_27955, partial [Aphanizomenon flos-aquae WA102]